MTDAIANALRSHGVWKGDEGRRKALATRLAADEAFGARGPEKVLQALYHEFAEVRKESNPGRALTNALDHTTPRGGYWLELFDDILAESAPKQLSLPGEPGESIRQDNAATEAEARRDREILDGILAAAAYEHLRFDADTPRSAAKKLEQSFDEIINPDRFRRLVKLAVEAKELPEPEEAVRRLLDDELRPKFTTWLLAAQKKQRQAAEAR